jgi:hypothetical protein
MNILTSFIPWIIFFLIAGESATRMSAAAIIAIAAYIMLVFKQPSKGKLLDYCSIIFFIALLGCAHSQYSAWITQHIRYLANSYLALVILTSILLKTPFTLAYAKEVTPKEKWQTKTFYTINVLISLVWFAFFIATLLIQPIANQSIASYIVLQIIFILIAMRLTKKTPEWFIQWMQKS